MNESRKTVGFFTLGCKVNQYDTSSVAELFQNKGYEIVDFSDKADVYVVNTCTVTGTGDKKSRQALRKAHRRNPRAIVVAMGCYVQVASGDIENMPEVDIIIGTSQRDRIVDLVEQAFETSGEKYDDKAANILKISDFGPFEELHIGSSDERTRAFVKIEDGCDQFCSYCKVPYARGPVRSRDPKKVFDQITKLIDDGYKEVVLIGIHLGAYGKDLKDWDLAKITAYVAQIPGVQRLRLGSIECTEVNDDLISVMKAYKNVCKHIHIPLQSGDSDVLSRMARPYNADQYADTVLRVKSEISGCAVTTDVIVGFPGETEREFENTKRMIESVSFSRLHVFKYSRRKGTAAAKMRGQVASNVKEKRSGTLIELGHRLSLQYHKSKVGQLATVLIEGTDTDTGIVFGHTDDYVRVAFACGEDMKNEFVDVMITEANSEGCFATLG